MMKNTAMTSRKVSAMPTGGLPPTTSSTRDPASTVEQNPLVTTWGPLSGMSVLWLRIDSCHVMGWVHRGVAHGPVMPPKGDGNCSPQVPSKPIHAMGESGPGATSGSSTGDTGTRTCGPRVSSQPSPSDGPRASHRPGP